MAYTLSMTGDSLFKRVSVAEFDVLTPMSKTRRIVNAVNVAQQESSQTHYVVDRQVKVQGPCSSRMGCSAEVAKVGFPMDGGGVSVQK